jgi:Ras-related GTP-binding protein A/B
MHIKTGRFMFFICRLTENTNLATVLPASEQVFNAARLNIMARKDDFAQLDIAAKPRMDVGQAMAKAAGAGWEMRSPAVRTENVDPDE